MSENAISTDVAVATSEGAVTAVEKINNLNANALGIFSTYTNNDAATKIAVYQAITDAKPVSDHVGTVINLANVVAQVVEVADDNGVLNSVVRTVCTARW